MRDSIVKARKIQDQKTITREGRKNRGDSEKLN
jgi:hypothetical protein